MEQVLDWLKDPNNPDGQCTHEETDTYAAQSLLDLKSKCLEGSANGNATQIDETDMSVSNLLLEMSAMEARDASPVEFAGPGSQASGSPTSVGTGVEVQREIKRQ